MINSLVKAHRIMQSFSVQRPRLSLAELARDTGYPRTTIYSLAATLVELGFLEKHGELYAVGPELIRLEPTARVNVEIRDRAAPVLRGLAEELGGSVYLTVPDGDGVLYIYAIESTHRLRARSAIGGRAAFHCTAVGKAMLAFMTESQADAILASAGLPESTANTITDRTRLADELATTRARGYSIDNEENENGLFCLGAPIFDATSTIVAACSVSDTDPSIVAGRLERASSTILAAGEQISRHMGFVPDRTGPYYAGVPA